MNWDQLEGKWKQLTGKLKEKWGKLTDDDLRVIRGQREQLIGKIQERHGIAKEEAARQVDEFARPFQGTRGIREGPRGRPPVAASNRLLGIPECSVTGALRRLSLRACCGKDFLALSFAQFHFLRVLLPYASPTIAKPTSLESVL